MSRGVTPRNARCLSLELIFQHLFFLEHHRGRGAELGEGGERPRRRQTGEGHAPDSHTHLPPSVPKLMYAGSHPLTLPLRSVPPRRKGPLEAAEWSRTRQMRSRRQVLFTGPTRAQDATDGTGARDFRGSSCHKSLGN